MYKKLPIMLAFFALATSLLAQVEPQAGKWKTWFSSSVVNYRLPAAPNHKEEIAQVLSQQQKLNAEGLRQIQYWSTGSPAYRWMKLVDQVWMKDIEKSGALSYLLFNVAVYDATVAAWDSKYTHKRPRPFELDKRIKRHGVNPDSPSYPCEHSVTAGVAVTIINHFFPTLADSAQHMAQRQMQARIAAGMAFPSDTKAGFELGVKIAKQSIEYTKDFTTKQSWDGKIPDRPGLWKGPYAMGATVSLNKTLVLESSSQFRPGPPPDFAKDMAELKDFKQTHGSIANAFLFDSQPVWEDLLDKKIFEYNLHLNPPQAARIYALRAIGMHDGFIACWDAKYAYWGIRPDQYDPTFKPLLMGSPPFPGYPSGHAAIGSVMGELFSYLFPAEKDLFQKTAKDGAESRFQGGVHFRTDNEVALELGKKVAALIIARAKQDGADASAGLMSANK